MTLCHTNRYLFQILSSDESIWKRFTIEHIPCFSNVIETTAKRLSYVRMPLKQNLVKINYLLHRKNQGWHSQSFLRLLFG